MSKASIIRSIVAAGFAAKSPNTLRRYPLTQLEAILAGLQAEAGIHASEPAKTPVRASRSLEMASYVDAQTVAESVSYDMPTSQQSNSDEVTYVPKAASVYVPTDRELYANAIGIPVVPAVEHEPNSNRWLALALAPWALALKMCGIA